MPALLLSSLGIIFTTNTKSDTEDFISGARDLLEFLFDVFERLGEKPPHTMTDGPNAHSDWRTNAESWELDPGLLCRWTGTQGPEPSLQPLRVCISRKAESGAGARHGSQILRYAMQAS